MNNAIPSVLYKYKAFSINSLDSLIKDTVYLADPASFNDPFDCQPSIVDDLKDISKLREITAHLMFHTQAREFMSLRKTVMNYIEYQSQINNQISLGLDDDTFLEQFDELNRNNKNEYRRFEEAQFDNISDEIDTLLGLMENCGLDELDNKDDIDMYERLIKKELVISRNMGVLSLAKNNDCPLMWAHYADDHQGFCCGYRLQNDPYDFSIKHNIQAVDYEGDRTIFTSQLHLLVKNAEDIKSIINDTIFYVKAKKWCYEKEYRMIGKPGLRKSPFNLESVYFGLRCKESVKFSIMSALDSRDCAVQFYQMSEVKGTFDLKPEPITLSDLPDLPISNVK